MGNYRYKLPGQYIIVGGSGREVPGLASEGFAVAPFCCDSDRDLPAAGIFTILPDWESRFPIPKIQDKSSDSSDSLPAPDESTDAEITNENDAGGRSAYDNAIIEISSYHKIHGGKTVFARRIPDKGPIDSVRSFDALCRAFPNAFVFLFETERSGRWIGASPELLLEKKDGELHTMALAGTRPVGSTGKWDEKNIGEQQMVVDFICHCFSNFGLTPVVGERITKIAGPVEHLCTPISAQIPDSFSDWAGFLQALSPTPALCGTDRQVSLDFIRRLEDSPREYYGGWCGPVREGSFSLYVNLRSAKINKDGSATLFAGGGITALSKPDDEWKETERKASTLARYIVYR